MNRNNGFNAKKPSPGFVYFNNGPAGSKPKTNPADTTNFLAFSDDNVQRSPPAQKQYRFRPRDHKTFSPPMQKFSPGYASSPIQYRQANDSPRGQGGYYREQYNHNSGSHNKSSSQYSRNSSNCDTSYTDSSFVNSSHNESRNNNSFIQRRGPKRNSNGETVKDISNFIHPSFFEDPWSILMKVVEDKWKEQELEEASLRNIEKTEDKDNRNEQELEEASSRNIEKTDDEDNSSSDEQDT